MLGQTDKGSHEGGDSPITIPDAYTSNFGTQGLHNKPEKMVRGPAGWSFQSTIA